MIDPDNVLMDAVKLYKNPIDVTTPIEVVFQGIYFIFSVTTCIEVIFSTGQPGVDLGSLRKQFFTGTSIISIIEII